MYKQLSSRATQRLLLLLGMFLVPSTVFGQFWQNTQGNSYPQYQGTSTSDSTYGGQQQSQQNGQQSQGQGQGQTSNIDIDFDDDMDPEDIEYFKVRWNENDEEENTPLSGLKKLKTNV